LIVNHIVVGTTVSLPNGDGSGVVNFSASADNATSYKILIGSTTLTSATGIFTYTFTQGGTNSYTVYVSAYNGTKFISASKVVIVYVIPTMAWADEFNVDGPPDSSKWSYETGAGGWGNNELQYYTSRPENVIVQGGLLKINLLKEVYMGSNYTSARIVTKNKFTLQYGRVDIRAKLPAGGGTWPALWMLGANIDSTPWPACGEIDIMEHVGNNLNRIYGTLHHPGHSGANGDGATVMINNATTDFHIYSLDWSATSIKFYVDNVLFYSFNNSSGLPFNNPYFFIFNCAMGGNFGGAVDPAFTAATLEVDYIHVYH
jgi:beta-glucanase (GH16 family)